MAFKINIKPEIEEEMDILLKDFPVRSKTEYINEAIALLNRQIRRQTEIGKLKKYFSSHFQESKKALDEFKKIQSFGD